jgi:hypothetical protein
MTVGLDDWVPTFLFRQAATVYNRPKRIGPVHRVTSCKLSRPLIARERKRTDSSGCPREPLRGRRISCEVILTVGVELIFPLLFTASIRYPSSLTSYIHVDPRDLRDWQALHSLDQGCSPESLGFTHQLSLTTFAYVLWIGRSAAMRRLFVASFWN